jgi:hypothetical protein
MLQTLFFGGILGISTDSTISGATPVGSVGAASASRIIDDFESGSLDSTWSASANGDGRPTRPRNTFEVQSGTVGEGDYALKGNSDQSDGGESVLTRNDLNIDSNGANLSIYVKLGSTLSGFERHNAVELGYNEADEFNRAIRLDIKNDDRADKDGTIVTDKLDSVRYVEFNGFNFDENELSELKIDGDIIKENVNFENSASEISRIEIQQGHFRNPYDVVVDEIQVTGDREGGGGIGESQIELPFTEQFEDGLNGWTVDQRYRLPRGSNPGDGGYSDKYGGSVRLHVDGGPSTIGVGHETTGIDAGTTITATAEVEARSSQPGNISVAIFAPDGDDSPDARSSNDGDVTSGETAVSLTAEEAYPAGSEIRVWSDVWPGEFSAYVTEITTRPPETPESSPYTDSEGYVDSEGLLDAGADYRNGEIDEDKLSKVASAFRSGEPLS